MLRNLSVRFGRAIAEEPPPVADLPDLVQVGLPVGMAMMLVMFAILIVKG